MRSEKRGGAEQDQERQNLVGQGHNKAGRLQEAMDPMTMMHAESYSSLSFILSIHSLLGHV